MMGVATSCNAHACPKRRYRQIARAPKGAIGPNLMPANISSYTVFSKINLWQELTIIIAHAGVSMVLMLTSSGLKAVCMQDTTDALLEGCAVGFIKKLDLI